ncbi:MAG: helix-turn-helix transcriptional regulator [Legionella sp.]|nr:helix-turn-helix transcriptional regulator [Legionella sp.]
MARTKPKRGAVPVDIHVGSQVRMRRLMLGMTQKELADSVGITFQQIQKYEKGTNRISASRLQEFAGLLKTPAPSFFEGAPNAATGEAGIPVAYNQFFATSEGLVLAKSFMKIKHPRMRRQIVELVEYLATNS